MICSQSRPSLGILLWSIGISGPLKSCFWNTVVAGDREKRSSASEPVLYLNGPSDCCLSASYPLPGSEAPPIGLAEEGTEKIC